MWLFSHQLPASAFVRHLTLYIKPQCEYPSAIPKDRTCSHTSESVSNHETTGKASYVHGPHAKPPIAHAPEFDPFLSRIQPGSTGVFSGWNIVDILICYLSLDTPFKCTAFECWTLGKSQKDGMISHTHRESLNIVRYEKVAGQPVLTQLKIPCS